jgi:hypothetical protein
MAIPKGYTSKLGYKKASAWDTPVACGAGDGVEILPGESLAQNNVLLEDGSFIGQATPYHGDVGKEESGGSFSVNLKYQGLEVLLAHILGTAGAPTQQGTTAAYKHTLTVANDVEGKFGTLVVDRGFEVHEYGNFKPNKFAISADADGQFLATEFTGLAHKRLNNGGTGTNNTTTIANVTFPTVRELIKFSQLKAYIDDVATVGALGAAHLVYIKGFSVDCERPVEGPVTTKYGTFIEEPLLSGYLNLNFKADFPALRSDDSVPTMLAAARTKTRQRCLLLLTGGTCDGAYAYEMRVWMPAVQFTLEGATAENAGVMPFSLNGRVWAHQGASAPTGFPNQNAITIQLVNKRNTDALA